MKLRLIFHFLITLGLLTIVRAESKAQQSVIITGQLLNSEKQPLGNQTAVLLNADGSQMIQETMTDSLGGFRFWLSGNTASGTYQIIALASKNAKVKSSKSFAITAGVLKYDLGSIETTVTPVELNEVKVIAAAPIYNRKLGKLVVNVENSVLANGNSVIDILPKLPGVRVDQSGNVSVNGKEGVMLMIDGKGQYVLKEQVATLLSNLKAESIKQLEIIANPSAKYDANQGSVINVITKKNYARSDIHFNYATPVAAVPGVNGFSYPNLSLGTNLNYKLDKIAINFSFDATNSKGYADKLEQTDQFYNLGILRKTTSVRLSKQQSFNTSLGLTYDINKKSFLSLDLFLLKDIQNRFPNTDAINFYSKGGTVPDSTISNNGTTLNDRFATYSVTLGYSLNLDTAGKKHLDVFYDLSNFISPTSAPATSIFYNATGVPYNQLLFDSYRKYKVLFNSVKVDYRQDLSKTLAFSGGVKFSNTNTSDTSNATEQTPDGFVQLAKGKFNYRESILGGYLLLAKQFTKLQGEVGLRGEYTDSRGYTSTVRDIASQNYFNLFPSLNLLYQFDASNKVSFAYNRRIVRIGFGDLNPIDRYSSPFLISRGDLGLLSQFINYAELTYQFKQFYISGNFSNRTNSRFDIPLPTSDATVQTRQFENIKNVKSAEINIGSPINYTQWWSSFNNVSFSNDASSLPNNRHLSYNAFSLYTSQNLKAGAGTNIEVSANYNSKYQNYYTITNNVFNLSAGVKQSLFNRSIDLSVTMSDILGTSRYGSVSDYDVQRSTIQSLRNNRRLNIGIKYNFKTGSDFGRKKNNSKGDFGEKRT